MPRYTDNDIQSACNVNLQEYLMAQGCELKKVDGKSKKLEGHGGLYIFEKGFYHFSEENKGNAIHFLRQYMDMDFQDAVQSLLDFQGIRREEELNPPNYQRNNSYQKKTSYKKPLPKPKPEQAAPQPQQPQAQREMPPEPYGIPPPPDNYDFPPEAFGIPPDDYDLPPEPFGTPPENGEVEFEVPSMSEHDSFQEQQAPQQNHPPPQERKPRIQPRAKKEESPKIPMELPPRSSDKNAYKSFLYLTQDRALDKDIVNDLMKQGKIFEATTQYNQ